MRTLIDALRDNAKHTEKGSPSFARTGVSRRLSYGDVWERPAAARHSLGAGDRARATASLLTLPEPDEFILTFFAALAAASCPSRSTRRRRSRGWRPTANPSRVLAASGANVLITNEPSAR